MRLYLYLLTQDEHNYWDTYDSCVVVAADREQARRIDPKGGINNRTELDGSDTWPPFNYVMARLLGVAEEYLRNGDVVCASYNQQG